jgi:hypothetical protein
MRKVFMVNSQLPNFQFPIAMGVPEIEVVAGKAVGGVGGGGKR